MLKKKNHLKLVDSKLVFAFYYTAFLNIIDKFNLKLTWKNFSEVGGGLVAAQY